MRRRGGEVDGPLGELLTYSAADSDSGAIRVALMVACLAVGNCAPLYTDFALSAGQPTPVLSSCPAVLREPRERFKRH